MTTQTGSSSVQQADLAIVICTYHREERLAKTLDSIMVQQCPPDLKVRIVVVDNSEEETASAVIKTYQDGQPFEVLGAPAQPPNISVARNAGIAAANAEYISFIDDDEQLHDGWLVEVARAVREMPFDVFFGRVEPDFEVPERATTMVRKLFSRHVDGPSGTEVFAMGPQKTQGVALATGNSVFRSAAIPSGPEPFDPALGHGGGEDYDLVCRMQRAGARFAWLPGACVWEFVPASRCDRTYLTNRFFAGGQAYAAAVSNASARPKMKRWALRLKALIQAGVLLAQWPVSMLRGNDKRTDFAYIWYGMLGKLSMQEIYPIYRR